MAISTKGRVYGGTPPYTLELRNNNNLIHTVYGNDDKLSIPDSFINPLSGILRFEIRDSTNKSNSVDIDKVSWNFMKNHHAGLSISNGDTQNHINAINESNTRGIKYLGVVYHEGDIMDDAALIALGNNGQYNHTQYYGSYLKSFDRVLSTAYDKGVSLKVSLWCTRDRTTLNNGTTRTMFISDADSQQREDGSPTSKHNGPASVVIGSYGSAQFKSFVTTLFVNFTKRYLPAILDGTIIAYGIATGNTAEEEFQYLLKDENNNDENPNTELRFSRGDFYPTIVNGFKTQYPEYNNLTNNQIGSSLLNSSQAQLGNRWRKYMESFRAKFVSDLIENTLTQVPGLRARAKFYQYDSSSLITQAARGNASAFQRFHKAALIVKSNDDTGAGTNGQRFAMDYNVAAARSVSAICMVEPTPGGHDFVTYRDQVNAMVQLCKDRGIHLSFVSNDWAIVDSIMSQFNLLPLVPPKEVSTFRTENNRLVTKRYIKNLSEIYELAYGGQNIMYSNVRDEYINFINSLGITASDIFVPDNVSPVIVPPIGDYPPTFKGQEVIVNNRRYTFIKSSGMQITVDPVTGRLSDTTEGLNLTTIPNSKDDRNAFYKLGEGYFGTSTEGTFIYEPFQNVYLPQGVHTIRRFDCKQSLFPNQTAFEANPSGYPPATGLNNNNCTLSEVSLIIVDL